MLHPGQLQPTALSALSNKQADKSAHGVWSGGVRAFQQGLQAEGQEPVLGDRTACALVLLWLAQLQLVAEPLAQLMQLLSSYGVGLSDAVAMLGSSTCELIIPPAQQMAALRLLEAYCAARCHAPDASELEALALQLQGLEGALQMWRNQQLKPAAVKHAAAQGASFDDVKHTAGFKQVAGSCSNMSISDDDDNHLALSEASGWRGASNVYLRRAATPQPPSPSSATHTKRQRRGEPQQGQWPEQLAATNAAPRVEYFVQSSPGTLPLRTPAADVDIPERSDFPRSVVVSGDARHRREFTELLLALGVIYAASEDRWPPWCKTMWFQPGHNDWSWQQPVAVDLDVLWLQLPEGVREFVEEDAKQHRQRTAGDRVSSAGDGASSGGGPPSDQRTGRSQQALASFIARHCTAALCLVEPPPRSRSGYVTLAAGWRDALVRHDLFRREVGRLEDDVIEAVGEWGEASMQDVEELSSRTLQLYQRVGGVHLGVTRSEGTRLPFSRRLAQAPTKQLIRSLSKQSPSCPQPPPQLYWHSTYFLSCNLNPGVAVVAFDRRGLRFNYVVSAKRARRLQARIFEPPRNRNNYGLNFQPSLRDRTASSPDRRASTGRQPEEDRRRQKEISPSRSAAAAAAAAATAATQPPAAATRTESRDDDAAAAPFQPTGPSSSPSKALLSPSPLPLWPPGFARLSPTAAQQGNSVAQSSAAGAGAGAGGDSKDSKQQHQEQRSLGPPLRHFAPRPLRFPGGRYRELLRWSVARVEEHLQAANTSQMTLSNLGDLLPDLVAEARGRLGVVSRAARERLDASAVHPSSSRPTLHHQSRMHRTYPLSSTNPLSISLPINPPNKPEMQPAG